MSRSVHACFALLLPTILLSTTAFAADAPKLWNGSFSDGGEAPAQWSKEGEVSIARDTTVFQKGPASLRVDAHGPSGSAMQYIEMPGARQVHIHGFLKTAGDIKAQVVVQAMDAKWTQNQWNQVKFVAGESDWSAFEKDVSLPEWTGRFRVMLFVEGKGSAWLDEVSLGDQPPLDGQALDPARDEPLEGKPWEPAWCIYGWRGAWVPMHESFVKRTGEGNTDIVFYGDSITMGWKDRWQDAFSPLKAVNYGIGGDSTRQLLWRIGHGEIDGAKPKVVVLMIGTNNLYGDKNAGTDQEIAKGIEAVVKLIRQKTPDAKLLLCAILPRQNAYFNNRIKAINDLIAPLADGKTIRFLDMRDVFLKGAGPDDVRTDLFVEPPGQSLHPNDRGYQAMMQVMKPVIAEMLK